MYWTRDRLADEDRVLYWEVNDHVERAWERWPLTIGILLALLLPGWLLQLRGVSIHRALEAGYLIGAVFATFWITQRILSARENRRLRRAFALNGYPVCVPCGYNLTGTPKRCPECGTPALTPDPEKVKLAERLRDPSREVSDAVGEDNNQKDQRTTQ